MGYGIKEAPIVKPGAAVYNEGGSAYPLISPQLRPLLKKSLLEEDMNLKTEATVQEKNPEWKKPNLEQRKRYSVHFGRP